MPDLSPIYGIVAAILPFECLQATFMRRALTALVLLAPMAAAMGVQVVNLRMAFFSDAVSHSAFAGVAIGLICSVHPHWSMPIFGMMIGIGIMAVQRNSGLSTDTVIGVFFSAAIAFGLAIVSREPSVARDVQPFLYGDILTVGDGDIVWLSIIFAALTAFQIAGYNPLLYIGIHPSLARAHRVPVALCQYVFAGLLALIVMFSVRAVGVLLVTALLIVPAAAARNFARSAGGMFWWAIIVGISSAVAGLVVSAQDWARTATGATVILAACLWFIASVVVSALRAYANASTRGSV